MEFSLRNAALGFVAAALSVVIVHQGIVFLLNTMGMVPSKPWSMSPVLPYGVPTIVNSIFWGGLWGALFGLVHDKLPGGPLWLKGLIYGLLIVVISNWLLLPLIKGQIFGVPNQVLFAGYDPMRLLAGALILGGFGTGLGIIFALLTGHSATA